MREIKFRAWDGARSRMNVVEAIDFITRRSRFFYDNHATWDKLRKTDRMIEDNDRLIFMQYAGLHDKNGKEIYEGDIVSGNTPSKSPFVVVPMLGGLSIMNARYLGQQHNELIAMPTNDAQTASWLAQCEVIGNIYENPELLEPRQ